MTDLNAQYVSIKEEIESALKSVIESSQFILGPEVEKLEKGISLYCDVKYAAGVASGTEALQLALLASGIQPGDKVITTPFTFIATSEIITHCGAIPVFIDIDQTTYNIDTSKLEQYLKKNGTNSRIKAILPVHLYGHPAEMDTIIHLSQKYNLKVIEDCAQALGARYKDKKVGSIGNAGCLSFFPSKILGAYGDGGMVITSDPQLAETVKMLRNHGAKQKYYHMIPGYNSRLDGLQAAVLNIKLKYLDNWIEMRREKANLYAKHLNNIPGISIPIALSGCYHCYNYYTVRLIDNKIDRDALQKHLYSKEISSIVYYPLSLHLQTVYKELGYKQGDFPQSEQAQNEVLSLPIYPEITEDQIVQVANAIREFAV